MTRNDDINDKINIAELKQDMIWIKDNLRQILEQTKITNGRMSKAEYRLETIDEEKKTFVTKKDLKIDHLSNKEKIKVALISLITSVIVALIGALVIVR